MTRRSSCAFYLAASGVVCSLILAGASPLTALAQVSGPEAAGLCSIEGQVLGAGRSGLVSTTYGTRRPAGYGDNILLVVGQKLRGFPGPAVPGKRETV